MIGMLGGVFSIASVAGPLLGGVLTDEISWRWWYVHCETFLRTQGSLVESSFYINLPIGGVVIILLLLVYKTPAHVKRASATWWELVLLMDLPSIVSLVASLICFNLGLEWGGITKDWSSADVVGTLVGAGVLGLVFVLIQWRQGERATVNPRIVSQRTIAACTAFAFL